MPPRAIWTGAISFGLVNVPVRMYSAVKEHKLHFQLVHREDEGPIGYQKISKIRPVGLERTQKAKRPAGGGKTKRKSTTRKRRTKRAA